MRWNSAKDLNKITLKARKEAIVREKRQIIAELVSAAQHGYDHWRVSVAGVHWTIDEIMQWLRNLGYDVQNKITAHTLIVSWSTKETKEEENAND